MAMNRKELTPKYTRKRAITLHARTMCKTSAIAHITIDHKVKFLRKYLVNYVKWCAHETTHKIEKTLLCFKLMAKHFVDLVSCLYLCIHYDIVHSRQFHVFYALLLLGGQDNYDFV